jgi:hypothetical protein
VCQYFLLETIFHKNTLKIQFNLGLRDGKVSAMIFLLMLWVGLVQEVERALENI